MMALRYDGRVAIVTGAGNGLGKAYALLLGSRGAKVVVNDLGGRRDGLGSDSRPADDVVNEIRAAGGKAVADYHSVEDGAAVVQTALDTFGRVDIVINNAGILRDRSFIKMTEQDWDLVHAVHLRGAFQVSRAAFPHLKAQKYGRIIFTSSVAGIYGNFGQANYSAAKLGVHGLAQTLAREGGRYGIHSNTIAPMGGTRLTEDILPPELFAGLKPELVAPLVAWLCHEDCKDNGGLFEAAGGWFGKYRFERTQGAVCRGGLHELVSPEAVRERWEDITSFKGALHPASNEEAAGLLASVLEELQQNDGRRNNSSSSSSAAGGGAALSGAGGALGYKQDPVPFTYTSRDVILYALGVGVSTRDSDHLKYLYEGSEDFTVLPTFAIIASQASVLTSNLLSGAAGGWTPNLAKLLHGEQHLEMLRPLPPDGATLYSTLEVQDVLDKRTGALLVIKVTIANEAQEPVATTQWMLYIAGEGKFGGARNSDAVQPLAAIPDRAPDSAVAFTTSPDQAALYRMSGDLNPLHIDPSFAAMGGFKQPILHGLCSLGIAVRAVISEYCGGDPGKVKAVKTRFVKPVLPGQTLTTEMWKDGSRIIFRCVVKESGEACLTGGYVDLTSASSEAVTAPSGGGAGSAIFQQLAKKVADQGPALANKVRGRFLFNITVGKKQEGQWTVDLKDAPGAVYSGPPKEGRPDVTLTLEETVLQSLVEGKLNPQKAFMGGQLKVAGNIMLSQKLQDLFDTNTSKM